MKSQAWCWEIPPPSTRKLRTGRTLELRVHKHTLLGELQASEEALVSESQVGGAE